MSSLEKGAPMAPKAVRTRGVVFVSTEPQKREAFGDPIVHRDFTGLEPNMRQTRTWPTRRCIFLDVWRGPTVFVANHRRTGIAIAQLGNDDAESFISPRSLSSR